MLNSGILTCWPCCAEGPVVFRSVDFTHCPWFVLSSPQGIPGQWFNLCGRSHHKKLTGCKRKPQNFLIPLKEIANEHKLANDFLQFRKLKDWNTKILSELVWDTQHLWFYMSKKKNIYFLYLFIYEQLKPQITTATLKQMEAKSSLLSDTSVRRDLTILCVKTFVSPYVSAFHSHLCNGPPSTLCCWRGPTWKWLCWAESEITERTYRTGAFQQPLIHTDLLTYSQAQTHNNEHIQWKN